MDNTPVDELVAKGRLLRPKDVIKMWGISREYLSRLTHHPNESKRIPSYYIGGPKYAFDELMYYRDNNRFIPEKRRKQNATESREA